MRDLGIAFFAGTGLTALAVTALGLRSYWRACRETEDAAPET
jgi:hypothetical protein